MCECVSAYLGVVHTHFNISSIRVFPKVSTVLVHGVYSVHVCGLLKRDRRRDGGREGGKERVGKKRRREEDEEWKMEKLRGKVGKRKMDNFMTEKLMRT